MRWITIGTFSTLLCTMAAAGCERDRAEQDERRAGETTPAAGDRAGQAPERAAPPATAEQGAQPGTRPAAQTKRELGLEVKTADEVELDSEMKLAATSEGVRLSVQVEDAKPGAKLRAVLHDKADCNDLATMSMGEPVLSAPSMSGTTPAKAAAEPSTAVFGDLGLIDVDQEGNGKLDKLIAGMKLESGDSASLIGKSIVLHEGDRSGRTNKDLGRPIACASISNE